MERKSNHPARSLLTQTRSLLRRFGLRARKGLGQHFLIDEKVLKSIVSAAELTPQDVIIEVGPGLGVLTRELARRAGCVIAVELDDQLAAILKETLAVYKNVAIVNEDVLKVNPIDLLKGHTARLTMGVVTPSHYKVVANLPYYITSPILRHFLEALAKPETMVVMVQKEVAEEITAEPGRMSLLSIGIQLYGVPTIVSHVPAESFFPPPEVDSAILRINVYPRPAVSVDVESFFTVVRAGFSAARKQIANSLAQGLGLPKSEVLPLLEKARIESQRRAETLTIEEWARLWRIFHEMGRVAC